MRMICPRPDSKPSFPSFQARTHPTSQFSPLTVHDDHLKGSVKGCTQDPPPVSWSSLIWCEVQEPLIFFLRFLSKYNIHTETHKGKTIWGQRENTRYKSRNSWGYQKLGNAWNRVSFRDLRGHYFCRQLDVQLLASRTRDNTFLLFKTSSFDSVLQ